MEPFCSRRTPETPEVHPVERVAHAPRSRSPSLANDAPIIYGGQLVDSLSHADLREMTAFLEKSPFAATPLVLYDVSSTNPWSCKLQPRGRYNLCSAVVSAELARRALSAGIESIGVISPYSHHARLIKMMLDDSGDAKLRHLKVSTVNKFQGLEQELIIYDVAEGPPVNPWFARDQGLDSNAAKLINVAITRPEAQLVIVANVNYLVERLRRPDSILLRVLEAVRQRGKVIDSREILSDYNCSDYDRWAGLLNPRDDGFNPDDSTLYTAGSFYSAFFADLHKSRLEIIIVSPFLTTRRATQFLRLFESKVKAGIAVYVVTRTLQQRQANMRRQAELVFQQLKEIGVQVVERFGLHQKFAFLDRKVAWEGSLNILSQSANQTTEHMRRIGSYEQPATKTCAELLKLHGLP